MKKKDWNLKKEFRGLRNAEKSDIVKCKEGGRCMIAEKEKRLVEKLFL